MKKHFIDARQRYRFLFRLLLSGSVSGLATAADLYDSKIKMTKLQLLNAYLTERLTVVVKEILDVVEDTVSEYREETARAKRENESLRRQLRDILLLEAETEWLSKGELSVYAPRLSDGPKCAEKFAQLSRTEGI